ncbi:MAG TPA: vitamin K epoxide reductase family protein [Chloroflexia bacterium]|nr:vitamin K epoxide reductase family protein [Chloroflexia bacterium]
MAYSTSGSIARGRVDWLNPLFLILTVVGIIISSYLTYTHFSNSIIICTPDHSCDTVNQSIYAYFPPKSGIPVSLLGLIGYVILAGLQIARWRISRMAVMDFNTISTRGRLDMVLFLGTLLGVVFSLYLTAMELWVIHAICWWCVGSAITISLLFILSVLRIWATE